VTPQPTVYVVDVEPEETLRERVQAVVAALGATAGRGGDGEYLMLTVRDLGSPGAHHTLRSLDAHLSSPELREPLRGPLQLQVDRIVLLEPRIGAVYDGPPARYTPSKHGPSKRHKRNQRRK